MKKTGYDPKTNTWTGECTESVFGSHIGVQRVYNIHSEDLCRGRTCVMHNPSDHHMRDWTMVWRSDKGTMERRCPCHGVGHPDPDDMAYHKSAGRSWLGVHGCTGCCSKETP